MIIEEPKYKLGQTLWAKTAMPSNLPIREVKVLGIMISPKGDRIAYQLSDCADLLPEFMVDEDYTTSKRDVYILAIERLEERVENLRKELRELDNE